MDIIANFTDYGISKKTSQKGNIYYQPSIILYGGYNVTTGDLIQDGIEFALGKHFQELGNLSRNDSEITLQITCSESNGKFIKPTNVKVISDNYVYHPFPKEHDTLIGMFLDKFSANFNIGDEEQEYINKYLIWQAIQNYKLGKTDNLNVEVGNTNDNFKLSTNNIINSTTLNIINNNKVIYHADTFNNIVFKLMLKSLGFITSGKASHYKQIRLNKIAVIDSLTISSSSLNKDKLEELNKHLVNIDSKIVSSKISEFLNILAKLDDKDQIQLII